jgi:UDP-N-acetylglucosamine diphosphorylase / glucose-1-phosphate thymidylyltransferase / UDP-N-acetylgalactosamine diphosphorylase / glucosamine-1-phosphate N-acetyltransferase / galactosamine-1-phosphate N-acetyltransferase
VTTLYLYDDAIARSFEPFALTRPFGEMRAGIALGRARWERALDAPAAGFVGAEHLRDFDEAGAPSAAGDVRAGSILANSRCVIPLGWSSHDADVWTCEGAIAAVRLAQGVSAAAFADGAQALESFRAAGTRVVDIPGRWIAQLWELVTGLVTQLREDIDALGPHLACTRPAGSIVIGGGGVYVEDGADVEPQVVFDVANGPVLVRRGAHVRAFTRLVGPCAVLENANVLGDRVSACSIGEASVVRGEMSETIVLGQSNKGHEGFVGHSYLGRWVNLGAGTITSNLKNTYGSVHLWTPAGNRDTGASKLGSMIGDHAKTGIGTRLTTGTVIGAGANVFGSEMPPRYVAPFSWMDGKQMSEFRLPKFLEIATRAMSRRSVVLSERGRRQLSASHARGRSA